MSPLLLLFLLGSRFKPPAKPQLSSRGADERRRRAREVFHVINLTNGIEMMPLLRRFCGVSGPSVGFCRIQSSHCEQCDFEAVLREIDHNVLVKLALGDVVLVHDCGSRDLTWPATAHDQQEEEQISVPRAIWWGLEVRT
jgi:hypothetical protein